MEKLRKQFCFRYSGKLALLVFTISALVACGKNYSNLKTAAASNSDDAYLMEPAASGGSNVAPTTTPSVFTGLYSPVAVTLTCADASGAGCLATYYTIDGTTPSRASTPYTGPIALWSRTTLKYFSIDNAGNTEAVKTEDLLIGSIAIRDIKAFAAGWNHTVGLKSDGTLWAWGGNDYGQLGLGNYTSRSSPQQVGVDTDWSAVAAGKSFTIALKNNGTLWAWGKNSNGQLGNNTTTNSPIPVQIGVDANWLSITAGDSFVLALKIDGTIWAWGANSYGQLGNNTTTDSKIPVQIGAGTPWTSIAAGYNHAVALRNDGTIWTWGGNSSGQLGDGTTADSLVPIQVPGTNWSAVAAGGSNLTYAETETDAWILGGHTVALKGDGTLWAWGQNIFGQLGDGTDINMGWAGAGTYPLTGFVTYDRALPFQIGTDTDWASISAGSGHTVALKDDGTLWAWGLNVNGQLANGNAGMNNLLPLPVGADTYLPYILPEEPWSSITAGGYHTVALRSDGTLWAWGWNGSGQLGDGTTISTGGGSDPATATWKVPKFAYATSDKVYTYLLDYSTGLLTSSGAATGAGTSPASAALHPTGNFLYVTDSEVFTVDGENVSYIHTFSVDRDTGVLTEVGGPTGVKTLSSPTSITVDPLGRFVYVVGTHSKGWQTIAVYTVNPSTGELSCTGTTAQGTKAMAIEPLGRFAYTLKNNGVTGYSIDQRTGILGRTQTFGEYDYDDDNEDDVEVLLKYTRYLAVDLSGQYLYVAKEQGSETECDWWGSCTTTSYPAEIRVYSINQTSGRIYDTYTPQGESNVSPMAIGPPGRSDITGVNVDSHTQYMYMLFDNNLNALALNQLTGQVTDVGLEGAAGGIGMAIEPTGKLIYVFTAGYVNGYAIDPGSGKTQVIGLQTDPTKMATDAGAGGSIKSLLFASY